MNHATRVHATIEEKNAEVFIPFHLFGLFIKNKSNSFQIIILSDFPLVVCKCLLNIALCSKIDKFISQGGIDKIANKSC